MLGLPVSHNGTYLATLKAVVKKYPHKSAGEILADMAKTTPGEEGTRFHRRQGSGAL